jgi:hypothetical protein
MHKNIAVIGANGYVGNAICKEIKSRNGLGLIEIIRADDLHSKLEHADLVIHAANPAKRFYAENHPYEDYKECVLKTFEISKQAKDKKIILISSLSARTQKNTYYGRHRKASEALIDNDKNLILRLGPMYGGGRTEDSLHDMLNNKIVYLDGATKYAYVNVCYAAKKIVDSLSLSGLHEIGAKNGIGLQRIKEFFNLQCVFKGIDDTQIPISPFADAPESDAVLEFCKSELKIISSHQTKQ